MSEVNGATARSNVSLKSALLSRGNHRTRGIVTWRKPGTVYRRAVVGTFDGAAGDVEARAAFAPAWPGRI